MAGKNTRERILEVALDLFSRKGYPGVSVDDIAQGVGIRPPSLYKHFPGKEAIFRALLVPGEAGVFAPALRRAEEEIAAAGGVTEEVLWGLAAGFMDAALTGEEARLRRLLALERYRDPALAELYARRWVEEPRAELRGLLARLIEDGLLRRGEAGAMADQFLAPVWAAIALRDTLPHHPEGEEGLRQHIHLFHRVFAPKPGTQPAQRVWRR